MTQIKELSEQLWQAITKHMYQFEELVSALNLAIVMDMPKEKIHEILKSLIEIVDILDPVENIVRMHYPQYNKLFDALRNKEKEFIINGDKSD